VADLSILVDEGRIGWDDRVADRLPGFEMHDPWVTREITIRDLPVHRSGLGLGEGTRFEDRTIEPAYVTFGLDAQGKVERITMKAASPLADFSYDYQDLLFSPMRR
jgi:CubicO group peptidase (beta-lactamase class C family)